MPKRRQLRAFDLKQIESFAALIGVDEVGRGALAGPVVAGAVLVNRDFLEGRWAVSRSGKVNDSKVLSAEDRQELWVEFEKLMATGQIHASFGVASVAEIEHFNILGATKLAMRRALEGIYPPSAFERRTEPDLFSSLEDRRNFQPTVSCRVVIDGLRLRSFPHPHEGIVNGDARSLCIAMASIVAKVRRDRLMCELEQTVPGYGFAQHKGYGTEDHREALLRLGRTPHHREMFLRKLFAARIDPGQMTIFEDEAEARVEAEESDGEKKPNSLDRVLGRLDRLDNVSLLNLVQRLARERAALEEIFNTLQEGVLVINAEGIIEYANQSAHRVIGAAGESLLDETFWRLVPGLRPSLEASLGEVQAAAAPVVAREFALSYPEPRTIRLYMVPFRQEGRPGGPHFAVILSDITAEKQEEGKRLEDERVSSILLLAAGVAHELGNPLNSLTIHLQLIGRKLKRQKAAPEFASVQESLAVCEDEVKRLDGIIRNFLEAIRPRPPNLAEIRLPDVLAEVLRFQQREFEDRGIRVEAETPDSLPAIMADPDQIKQVFFNLTKNALEAMQPGGTLRIRSRSDDDSVYLLFGDSGSGIRQDDVVKLFQPYHTTKAGGHGLGLMIVQRIMRSHGGQVGIESKERVGTVVTLQLPRKDRRIRMLSG